MYRVAVLPEFHLTFLWLLKWISLSLCVSGDQFVWDLDDKPVKYNEVCDSIGPYHKNQFWSLPNLVKLADSGPNAYCIDLYNVCTYVF